MQTHRASMKRPITALRYLRLNLLAATLELTTLDHLVENRSAEVLGQAPQTASLRQSDAQSGHLTIVSFHAAKRLATLGFALRMLG